MSLRSKVIILLALALILLEIGLNLVVSKVLLKDFTDLEAKTVERNVERGVRAISAEYSRLAGTISESSDWADADRFIKDKDASYVKSDLTREAMLSRSVEYILFFGPDGRFQFGKAIDPVTKHFRSVPTFVTELLPPAHEFLQHSAGTSSKTTGFLLPDGFVLMASMPILSRSDAGPIRGTLILGRYLTSGLVSKLSTQANLTVSTWLLNQPGLPSEVESAERQLRSGARYYAGIKDEDRILGYGLLRDFYGNPAVVIGVTLEREIYQQGRQSIRSMSVAILISGLIFSLLVLLLIERSVLTRVVRLSTQVSTVAKTGDSTARVDDLGQDELGELSVAINTMLLTLGNVQEANRAAKEGAQRANNAKSQFVANISHEIRTPINGIMGMTQVMLNNEKNPDTREYLKMVKESAGSLLSVINDLLDISKVEAGKLILDSAPMEVRQVIREALQAVSLRAYEKGLELIADVEPIVPDAVVCDSLRLRQILINLIGNSIKFTERGQIVVKVATLGGSSAESLFIKFSVIDSGIGIPAHKLSSVFDAFTQADGSTARKYGGTGLGLTITKELVKMMGGDIWVESVVGHGTIFSFTLDLKPIALSDQSSKVNSGRYDDLDLLLVDDNPLIRGTLFGHLSSLGINVVSVADIDSAIAAFEEVMRTGFPFKLLVVDSILGQRQGLSLLSTIRSRWPKLATHIIAMIPCHKLDERQSYRELGVSRIVSKPLMSEDVSHAIDVLLGFVPDDTRSSGRLPQLHSTQDRSMDILIADDVKVNQKVLRLMLEQHGHRIQVAENGQQVVESLRLRGHFDPNTVKNFDLILMDVQMPELDGVLTTVLIRELETLNNCRHIPIIAVTANATQAEREQFLHAGMTGFLSKPINPGDLFRLMTEYGQPQSKQDEGQEEPLTGKRGFEQQLRRRLGSSELGPIVDTNSLFERFADDSDLVSEIVATFVEEWPTLLSNLRLAIGQDSAIKVRKAAHALKGSLANVSAVTAWQLVCDIEQAASDGQIALEKFAQAEQALVVLSTAFSSESKTPPDVAQVHSEQSS